MKLKKWFNKNKTDIIGLSLGYIGVFLLFSWDIYTINKCGTILGC